MSLQIVPIFFDPACDFIKKNHRHHKPPIGRIFQIAVHDGEKIVGVAICGRPVSPKNQDGYTMEVNRLCTDGTPNACSKLLGACWRITKELGYKKLITFILTTEPGTSLQAAGFTLIGERRGYTWNSPSRLRIDKHPTINKLKFEKVV